MGRGAGLLKEIRIKDKNKGNDFKVNGGVDVSEYTVARITFP